MAQRVDENGAAYAGSQLQTQLYVNRRTAALDDSIRDELRELADARFEWRSPCADDNYREYYGAAFLRRLGLDAHVSALKEFWPPRGPQWDALALAHFSNGGDPGVVLVEGKSYPNEMLKGSGVDPERGTDSRALIENALAWTQGRIGIPMNTAAWCGPVYQNANRFATLYWLRSRGVRAWLVHLLFLDDPHRRTTAEEWAKALTKADAQLGLTGVSVDGAGHALLPAGSYEELVAPEAR